MTILKKLAMLVLIGMFCALGWSALEHPSRAAAAPAAIMQPKVALLAYDLASGTDAGTNTGGAWTQRQLNTEVYDPGQIVALSSNRFTLREGTYLVDVKQTIMGAHGIPKSFRGRLRNVTAGTTVGVSLNVRLHEELNESASIVSPIPTMLIDLDGEATFELQYYCETADANTWALGLGFGTGEVERYASVFIEKIN